ncbi:MAG: hypothetical protein WAU36_09200 [Cyclobacteriaceae bacterium]
MKQRILILAVLILAISACKDDGLSAVEQTKQQLMVAPWGNPTVTVDGVDESDLYKDFSITFGDGTYTSINGDPVWPGSGTWQFKDDAGKIMLLDGSLEVVINSIDDENLELELNWDETTYALGGRVSSIFGKNYFFLKRSR